MVGAFLWAGVPLDAGGAADCSQVLLALQFLRVPATAMQLFTA